MGHRASGNSEELPDELSRVLLTLDGAAR